MDGEVLYEWRAEFERVFPGHPRSERAKEHRRNFWRDALGVVLGDALRITRLLGTCEIADGAQLLDQLGLARRSGGRARRWGSRLTIPSVPITVDATTKPARKRAEEEGEEPARSV
jgi:hypothetical protein